MAITSIDTNPFLVSAADTNDNVLALSDSLNKLIGNPQKTIFIEVTVGTFRFSLGSVVTGNEPTYTVGDKVPLPLTAQLHFKATTIGDKFKCSIV